MHTHKHICTYTHIEPPPPPQSSSPSRSCHQPPPPPNLTSPSLQTRDSIFVCGVDEQRSEAHINKRGLCMQTSLVTHLRGAVCAVLGVDWLKKSELNVKCKEISAVWRPELLPHVYITPLDVHHIPIVICYSTSTNLLCPQLCYNQENSSQWLVSIISWQKKR